MLRLHRRNLSASKRFRLRLLQMVSASVTPSGRHISLCQNTSHYVCIYAFVACFLTFLGLAFFLTDCAEDAGNVPRPAFKGLLPSACFYLLNVYLVYIFCKLSSELLSFAVVNHFMLQLKQFFFHCKYHDTEILRENI